MNGAFNASVRVLMCSNCGAPLPFAPAAGGQIACQFCRTVTMIAPRDDRPMTRGPVNEEQRLARLWSQIKSGMMVHGEARALTEAGMLPERNVQAAMQLWEQTRRRQAVDPVSTGDDLLWLTTLLSGFYGADRVRVRALWESALETSREPRHRQYIRCCLSRAAAKDGDLQAAWAWLAPCDPYPDDLLCDTSYRLAYAFMATCRGDFAQVLQALGPRTDSVPLFFAMRALCHVLRADAFEKTGDVATATAQLRALIDADNDMRAVLPAMQKNFGSLSVCAQSIPRALS